MRQKLNRKAAEEPAFRFYALYDRIYRPDVLMAAYQRVRRKRGAAGVDGITFSKIEEREGGVALFLEELHESLKQKTYGRRLCKTGIYTKAGWKAKATWHSHDKRQGSPDGNTPDTRTDI